MLFNLAAWVVILFVALVVGRGVLALLRVDDLRPGDAYTLATWLGVVALAVALLAASVAVALTPLTASAVAAALAALGTIVRAVRRAPASAPPDTSPTPTAMLWGRIALGSMCLAVGAAALTSDPVTLYDSLVYHIGIVRWLHEYGTVHGMTLVHNRLGHVSAWFTLAAPFDQGPGAGAAATIPLGVALVLVGLQAAIAAGRVVARRALLADWFFVLLTVPLVWAVNARSAATPSPDVATNVLIAVAAWSVLVTSEPVRGPRNGHRNSAAMIPLILALGGAAMKLFAVPAAAVAAGYYIAVTRESGDLRSTLRAAAIAAAATALVLGPFLAANVVASGCPVYPSPIACTELPWSVGAPQAADYASYIRDVARWDRRGNIPADSPMGWVVPWVRAHPVVTLLAILSPAFGWAVIRHGHRGDRTNNRGGRVSAMRMIVTLALVGVVFAAWQAPATRFLYAVAVLTPALACGYWLQQATTVPGSRERQGSPGLDARRFATGFLVVTCTLGLAYAIASQKLNVWSALTHGAPFIHGTTMDLVAPAPPQPQPRLFRWRVNDIEVLTPVPAPIADTLGYHSVIAHNADFEKCSTAPLPCTPYLPARDVRLRQPWRGLAGGLVRTRQPGLAGRTLTCIGQLLTTSHAAPRPREDVADDATHEAGCSMSRTR